MEIENNDVLKESLFTIKFVSLKTPSASNCKIPESLYFVFKFFTFKNVQTEPVSLHIEQN